jgi:hypothetical protein
VWLLIVAAGGGGGGYGGGGCECLFSMQQQQQRQRRWQQQRASSATGWLECSLVAGQLAGMVNGCEWHGSSWYACVTRNSVLRAFSVDIGVFPASDSSCQSCSVAAIFLHAKHPSKLLSHPVMLLSLLLLLMLLLLQMVASRAPGIKLLVGC